MCVKSELLTSLRNSYNGPWACLETLAGSAATRKPSLLRDGRPLPPSAELREGPTWNGGKRGHPPSQISRINPSDQWGNRCRSQIALTSEHCSQSTLTGTHRKVHEAVSVETGTGPSASHEWHVPFHELDINELTRTNGRLTWKTKQASHQQSFF
ncbi:hypothetical protein GJAV_G00152700 [Gymnothorax javanicus]|nr:hypothetical protein GJAV_G00152700 [Gymnothorax javanicus]